MKDTTIIILGGLTGAVVGGLFSALMMGWLDYKSCEPKQQKDYSVQVQDGVEYHTYLQGV